MKKHCKTCVCKEETKLCPACGNQHKVVAVLEGLKVIGCPTVEEGQFWLLNDKYFNRLVAPELLKESYFRIPDKLD